MANSAPVKGTELRGTQTFVPGAVYGPALPNLGRGDGTGTTIVVPPGTPAVIPRDVLAFRPNVGDESENLGGTAASLVELNTINPAFNGKGWLFPGAAGDDNSASWVNFPIPSNLAATPNLRIRLHIIVPL